MGDCARTSCGACTGVCVCVCDRRPRKSNKVDGTHTKIKAKRVKVIRGRIGAEKTERERDLAGRLAGRTANAKGMKRH